ncbi:MAG: hypothetical protein ACPG4T_19165, partial [Nannocystaceae bacterium]
TWIRGADDYRGSDGPLGTCAGNDMRLNPLYQAFVDAGTPRAQVLSKVYEGAEASVAKPAPKAASKAPAGG